MADSLFLTVVLLGVVNDRQKKWMDVLLNFVYFSFLCEDAWIQAPPSTISSALTTATGKGSYIIHGKTSKRYHKISELSLLSLFNSILSI